MKRRERHPASQKAVRIVVLGDPGAGKSSIITVFISGHFEENISPLIPVAVSFPTTIKPKYCGRFLNVLSISQVLPPEATTDNVSVTLVDT